MPKQNIFSRSKSLFLRQVSFKKQRAPDFKQPYQTVFCKGRKYPGRFDSRRMFYAFDLQDTLSEQSFLDLGCNRGALVFLAEEYGASHCLGVDANKVNVDQAKEIASENRSHAKFVAKRIQDFVPGMENYDITVCMAVFRHLYADLALDFDPSFRKGKGFLTFNSMDVLIRQNVGHSAKVTTRFNDILSELLEKTRHRFICSYNDESGLILRRQKEVEEYFSRLSGRVRSVEVYRPDISNPKFTAVDLSLKDY
jgi:SAM-dependent methyltransferase